VKGVSELVLHGETGYLVPSENAEALTEAVLRLTKDKEACQRMGLQGRDMINKDYSIDKMVDRTWQVYNL
jgi:glycosyltransferase involved in cell wall biosynthesis